MFDGIPFIEYNKERKGLVAPYVLTLNSLEVFSRKKQKLGQWRRCHDITLLRGWVAGLSLTCIKGGALGYKSTGRSRIYESKITINTINLPLCLYAPPVNLDSRS